MLGRSMGEDYIYEVYVLVVGVGDFGGIGCFCCYK